MSTLIGNLLVPWLGMMPFVLVAIATADMLAGEWCPARREEYPDEVFVAIDPAGDEPALVFATWNAETGVSLVEPSKLG